MAIPAKQRWIIYFIALALTVVAVKWAGGQDDAEAQPPARAAEEGARSGREASAPAAATTESAPELRLDRLGPRSSPTPAGDPFQARSWAPPPDPQPAARRRAPPPPQAPPLPFAYMGKMVDDGATSVFLANQDRNYVARVGDTLDGTYRVDSIDDNGLVVTYLPLKQKQTLAFGDPRTPAAAPPKPQPRAAKPADDDDDD